MSWVSKDLVLALQEKEWLKTLKIVTRMLNKLGKIRHPGKTKLEFSVEDVE